MDQLYDLIREQGDVVGIFILQNMDLNFDVEKATVELQSQEPDVMNRK